MATTKAPSKPKRTSKPNLTSGTNATKGVSGTSKTKTATKTGGAKPAGRINKATPAGALRLGLVAPAVPGTGTVIAVIGDVQVTQDPDNRVYWQSGAAVDADGANGQNGNRFAYRFPDNDGLDDIKSSAGYPNGKWRDILVDDGNGKPLTDGNENAYSKTTYTWPGRSVADRAVDATAVPYVVVNPQVRMNARGIVIGCKAVVTYNGQSVDAVAADVSGGGQIGEISIAAAKALGIPSSPRDGGVDSGVQYSLWPGTPAVVSGETYLLERAGG
jgi:Fungal chitosanase of glycosyl hydrolase group 75